MATSRRGLSGDVTADEPSFAELFTQLPVATLVLDADGRIARANAEAEALLNVSERAMLGEGLAAVLTPPPGYAERREEHGFAAYDVELRTARAGRLRADFLDTGLVEHPGWRLIALRPAATTRGLGQSADRAAAARAATGAAAMLAHEIKNPLSGIRGAAQLLAKGGDGREELTSLITAEVDRIASLIDRMQDFTDSRTLPIEPANIYPLLDHARRVALAGFARQVPIDEQFDPSLPPVLINADALLQVMLNLIKNAAEAVAGQANARITLATAYRHGMALSTAPGRARTPLPIELCVIDNGPGAPAEIAEHLFDPFVSGKPDGQGRGLGLALVDKLVRDMGGIIQYAREGMPEATVFRILLPRAPA